MALFRRYSENGLVHQNLKCGAQEGAEQRRTKARAAAIEDTKIAIAAIQQRKGSKIRKEMARIRETRRHSLKRKKECDDESEGEEPPLNAAMLESDTEDEGPDFSTATGIVAYLQANWESCHRLDAKLPDDKDQFQKAVTLVAEVLGTRKKEGANCHEFPQFNNRNRPLLSGVQMVNRCAIEILEYYGSEREMFDIPGLETLLFKWTGKS